MGNIIGLMENEEIKENIQNIISVDKVSPWEKGQYKTITIIPIENQMAIYTINSIKWKIINTKTSKLTISDTQKIHIFLDPEINKNIDNVTIVLDYQDNILNNNNIPNVSIATFEKRYGNNNINYNNTDLIENKNYNYLDNGDEIYFGCCQMYKSILNSILYYQPLVCNGKDCEINNNGEGNKENITYDFYKSRKDMKFADWEFKPKYR